MKIEESKNSRRLKEGLEDNTYYAEFYGSCTVPIKASSYEEAEEKALMLEGSTTEEGFYLSQFDYICD